MPNIWLESPQDRRRQLVAALRTPLPEDFVWDFDIVHTTTRPPWLARLFGARCHSVGCALGLAMEMWPEVSDTFEVFSLGAIACFFGIADSDANAIFYGDAYGRISADGVTPAMVADALEAAPERLDGPAVEASP